MLGKDEGDFRVVDLGELNKWTEEAGLMGLIMACIKEHFLDP